MNFYTFNPILAAKWLLNLYKSMANTKNATVREISINVIPNFELESRILGQGMHMMVLTPKEFREKLYGQINNALHNYNNLA